MKSDDLTVNDGGHRLINYFLKAFWYASDSVGVGHGSNVFLTLSDKFAKILQIYFQV